MVQVSGYMGSGLNPFVNRFGAAAHAAKGLFGGPAGPQLRSRSQETEGLSQVFAQDIVSRIGPLPEKTVQTSPGNAQSPAEPTKNPSPTSAAATDAPQAGMQAERDPSGLQQSLSRAVDFVRANFGDAAAQATMGLIYKRVGNQEVTEENLGRGMLDALRFIDRNFGFAAGDKVMAFFNQDVNRAMNDYFDNGLMETFYAVSPGGKGQAQGLQLTEAMQEVAEKYGQDAVESLLQSLEQALQEGEKPGAALRRAVASSGEQMAAQYGGDPEHHAALIGQSLAPLLHGQGMAPPPQVGGHLNLTV